MNEYRYNQGNVPREVSNALYDAIEERELEYADNFRFSPVDDGYGLNEYEDIKARGCCGSWDGSVKDDTGRVWQIGCNYGH